MYMLVDFVHFVYAKERVPGKSLVVILLEAVNTAMPNLQARPRRILDPR